MDTKIVIFDLDGTLLNTLEDLTLSTNFALSQFDYPQKTIEEIRQFVGNGVVKLIERVLPDGLSDKNFDKCLEIFKQNYKENMFNKTKPYPDIIPMLEKLRVLNIKTAVVSNKFDAAVRELCSFYFKGLIDFSAGENEKTGIMKKPAPDTVFQVLRNFGYEQNDTVYVGDSEVDIQTAQNAGIECISVSWGFKDKQFLKSNGAKIIIDKPDEIFQYL